MSSGHGFKTFKIHPGNLATCDTRNGKQLVFFENEEHILMTMIDRVHEQLQGNTAAELNLRDRVIARMTRGRKINRKKAATK